MLLSILTFILKCAGYLLFFFALALLAVYFMQNRMLYIPDAPNAAFKYPENNPRMYRNPAERNMLYDDVSITTSDNVVLRGWFIKQKNPIQHETIIFFHENAGNIGNRLACFESLYFELEVNILVIGYRGYGHSQGVPTEQGLEFDAEAMMKYALEHKDINNSKLFFLGKSLGGAVAIQLAEKVQEQICGLILENTFVSISEMVDRIFPIFTHFKKLIQRIYWPSIDRIPKIRVPILFIVGSLDEIVPSVHTNKLHEAATSAAFKQVY